MSEVERTATASVRYLLSKFPCVVVLGARQVGKTTLLRQVLPEASFHDLERFEDFDRIRQAPEFVISRMKEPVVIDEAQRLPEIFSALRVLIDKRRSSKGRFLLSGSSSPELMTKVTESLAGRVAIFELNGFSLEESWGLPHSGFYRALEQNQPDALSKLRPRLTADHLLASCLNGSYPEPVVQRDDRRFVSLWMENYIRTYIDRDVRSLFPDLKLHTYRKFISMLGNCSGQIVNASEFARSLDVSQPTVKSYLAIAEGTFLWRSLSSFGGSATRRVAKMPKGHMRDSGLVCHMLKLGSIDDFLGHPLCGRIWEAFITEEIIKGLRNRLIPADFHYYRTHHGVEIDLILELGRRILPIEIKLGPSVNPADLRWMLAFVEEQRAPYGLVINNSDSATWLREGILQIPAGCL